MKTYLMSLAVKSSAAPDLTRIPVGLLVIKFATGRAKLAPLRKAVSMVLSMRLLKPETTNPRLLAAVPSPKIPF